MKPFLTVLTRHMPERADLLARNQSSLAAQTNPDYEQLVLVDDAARGFDYANMQLAQATVRANGRYVLLLDDDDLMENVDGIAMIKQAAKDCPPVVVFRGRHADLGVLPDNEHWRQRPAMGQIGSFDFITRVDLFAANVETIKTGGYASDYRLIEALWLACGEQFAWLDAVICTAPQRSLGAREVYA